MPRDTKEPQSYGSGSDWVKGKSEPGVHNQKSEPTAAHRDFYDERRESEESNEYQGGRTSEAQLAESAQAGTRQTTDETTPVQKVTAHEGGAKRDSYFRKRDYE